MESTPIKTVSLAVLTAVVVLVFSPALNNGFTNWDDEELLTENIQVRDLSWGNARRIFGSSRAGTYIPFTILSYSLEYRRWGLDPRVYHATNLILHALNACLVLTLFYLLGAGWWPALMAALLWAVHPLRVESVAWVTERKDVLFVFFFLWSMICHLLYLKKERWIYYLLSFLLFAASGLSKGMAMVLPPILLLTDFIFASRPVRRVWLEQIPFFAAAAFMIAAAFWAQSPGGFNPEYDSYHLGQRVLIAGHNLVFYLGKILWPVKLSALYPYPNNGDGSLPWSFWAAPAVLAVMLYFTVRLTRSYRAVGWGVGFFLIAVAPVLQLVRLLGPAMTADRYTYLPAIGLSFMLALALGKAGKYISGRKRVWRLAMVIFILMPLTVFAGLSWRRCQVWENSLTLWDDVIDKYPQAAVAYNNRGKYFFDHGAPSRALADYNQALDLQPGYVTALGNRALFFIQAGEHDQAISDLDRAIDLNPMDTRNINNRGALYIKQGDFPKALSFFNTAIAINPQYSDAYYNRSLLYYVLNNLNQSLNDLNQVIILDPYYAKAYLKRARLYLDLGQVAGAMNDARKAIFLDPGSPGAYNILGLAYGTKGENSRAFSAFNQALNKDSLYAETYNNLALLNYIQHDYKKADKYLKKAQRLGYFTDKNLELNIKRNLK